MNIHSPRPFEPQGGTETPEAIYRSRRRFLKGAAAATGIATVGGIGYAGWRLFRGSDAQVLSAGRPTRSGENIPEDASPATASEIIAQAPSDGRFGYGRAETDEAVAARYTNFYEFSTFKWSWRLVDKFVTDPWTLSVGGACRNPMKLNVDELLYQHRDAVCQRQYRHRCVETWAMAVPWIGFPLAELIRAADPLDRATHVRFVSFNRPDQAPNIGSAGFDWPYSEGLTLAEATNELTFLATGMYGHALLKQHGAPVRLVVPWKYGFKSIKSIQRIELVTGEPSTFWTSYAPHMYPFESNVEPAVARPWNQRQEKMLGTGEVFPTQKYNGYEKYVSHLYR